MGDGELGQFAKEDGLRDNNAYALACDGQGSLLAYRDALLEKNTPQKLLGRWRWKLRIWNEQDRKEFYEAMRRGWERFMDLNPHLQTEEMKKKFSYGDGLLYECERFRE